jgi:hypothetical protein
MVHRGNERYDVAINSTPEPDLPICISPLIEIKTTQINCLRRVKLLNDRTDAYADIQIGADRLFQRI